MGEPMICPYCVQGFVYKKCLIAENIYLGHGDFKESDEVVDIKVPCEECGGMGIIHCCEGSVCNE